MNMEAIAGTLAEHGARISALEDWQERQNGSLVKLNDKIDKIYWWIIGLTGTVAVSAILLAANLYFKK